jgi:hypothetical protein
MHLRVQYRVFTRNNQLQLARETGFTPNKHGQYHSFGLVCAKFEGQNHLSTQNFYRNSGKP